MPRILLALALSLALGLSAAEVPFTSAVLGPAAAHQFASAAASDGSDYLVVWHDQRTLPHEAYATRVSRDGKVLDPTGIRLPIRDPYEADVIWTGSSYLVVWWSARDFALVAARISREGVVIDPPRVLEQDAQGASLTRAGNLTVVGFLSGKSYPQEPHALFLDQDGNIVSRVRLATGNADRASPSVAWNGTHVVAVWNSGSLANSDKRVEGVRLTANGLIDAQPREIIPLGEHVMPQIASDGRDFVMIVRAYYASTHRSMHIGADLTPGPLHNLPISEFDAPSFLWTGSNYVLVYDYGATITALRLGRDARMIDEGPIMIETPPGETSPAPRAATNGSELFLTWSAPTAQLPDDDVYGAVLSASNFSRRATALLSMAAPRQTHAVVAAGPRNVLSVWNESGGTYARRMSADGASGDAVPIRIGRTATATAAVFNGTDYVVATLSAGDGAPVWLTTVRIPDEGSLRAENQTIRPLTYGTSSVALAHAGGVTLLAWHSAQAIEAARLAANGSWIDSTPLTVATGRVRRVGIAPGGDPAFLLTWEEYETICCHGETGGIAIRGARITSGLTQLEPGGLLIAAADGRESEPSAAWNGREWLVVWQRTVGNSVSEIRARRVAANGTLPDAVGSDPGVLLASNGAIPRLEWDGSRYVLAWLDRVQPNAPSRMHVAHVTHTGERSQPRLLGEAEALAVGGPVSLALLAPGRVAVAYARIAREPIYGGVSRAFLDVVTAPPPGKRRAVRS